LTLPTMIGRSGLLLIRRITFATAFVAQVALLGAGCGGSGPSPEETMRSQREFELGVSLMREASMPQAYEHLLRAVQLDPQNAEAHHILGVLFTARGEFSTAERHLVEAARLADDPEVDSRPSLRSEIRNSRGVLLIHQGRHDDAIAELRTAAADLLYTTPYLAWANLGLAYLEKDDARQAILALEESVRLQRDFCLGYLRLGKAYLATDDFTRADTALTRVVEVDNRTCNTTQEAWQLRGESRAALGRTDDAVHDLERCVELGSETAPGRACRQRLETIHP
jgi:type IV pilus assembly protein PilF